MINLKGGGLNNNEIVYGTPPKGPPHILLLFIYIFLLRKSF
ncbi:hypothetical protein [Pseudomonas phage D6]|nr:hypothetical protein [Pseudomonas phage D6]